MPFAWLVTRGGTLLLGFCWALMLLGLLQALGWSGGPNLAPLVPIVLLALILARARQRRGLSASASEAVPEPRSRRRRLSGAGAQPLRKTSSNRSTVPPRPEIGVGGGEAEAGERRVRALGEDVGGAGEPQVRDQPGQGRIAHLHHLAVRDRQSEARAGEQIARRAHVDLRMDARGGVAPFRRLGRAHRPAQARQAAGAGEGGEKQAVRLQRAADQAQRAGQIVDRVEQADRDGEIEAAAPATGGLLLDVRDDLQPALPSRSPSQDRR